MQENEITVIDNDDGSRQIEIPIKSVIPFDPEKMDVDSIFNFDEMRASLEYDKDGFTVHPYPKDDFTPMSIHDTLEMWNVNVHYHCEGNEDADCIIDVYSSALEKIDSVIKERLGRKWGLHLMPNGYSLAIIHNYDVMVKEMNKLMLREQKKQDAINKRSRISAKIAKKLKK